MKTQIVCPNLTPSSARAIVCPDKTRPEWKKLVEDLGDERLAYLAFFRNNDTIPDLPTAIQKLGAALQTKGLKQPAKPIAPPAAPAPQPVPKAAKQFRRVVMPKIKAESFTTLPGRTRQNSKVLTEA